MAGPISHYLLAHRVLNEYLKSGGAPVCHSAFCWGAQGPDFLFYGFPFAGEGKNLAVLGSRMHKGDPVPLFAAMRSYCENLPQDDPIRSYVLGFLCHYSLDRIVHPYVYAQIRELKKVYPERPGVFLHSQIETALDNITLRYEEEELPTSFDLRRAVPKDPAVQRAISVFYEELLRSVYHRTVKGSAVLSAMRNCRFVGTLQNDRTGFKKSFFEKAEKLTGKYYVSCFFHGLMENDDYDYANVSVVPWYWPPAGSRPHCETYLDLYRRSAKESLELIAGFYQEDFFEAACGHIPFS